MHVPSSYPGVHISIHALFAEGDVGALLGDTMSKLFLSTPSSQRATYVVLAAEPSAGFLSTPSSQRATLQFLPVHHEDHNFYPRPLRRGRPRGGTIKCYHSIFLSTPSSQRATFIGRFSVFIGRISIHALFAEGDHASGRLSHPPPISIHALFAEGDMRRSACPRQPGNFYPRPLRRGRRFRRVPRLVRPDFYPRPLRRGRQSGWSARASWYDISIHALFAEGDQRLSFRMAFPLAFLSTPSSQRATEIDDIERQKQHISIHALFAEGDALHRGRACAASHFYPRPLRRGRPMTGLKYRFGSNFYPRPLRRGRPGCALHPVARPYFYPRPLRRGRRNTPLDASYIHPISIHALFAEGDVMVISRARSPGHFYPRPLRRGRLFVPL